MLLDSEIGSRATADANPAPEIRGGRCTPDALALGAATNPMPVDAFVELWRQRQDLGRAAQRLNLQCQALCRRFVDGDKAEAAKLWAKVRKGTGPADVAMLLAPYLTAMAELEKRQHEVSLDLGRRARKHPLWIGWGKDVRGLGEVTFSGIIGEAGRNPGEYRSVSALWKRFGLAVINGGRQRLVAGNADLAIEHGYNPQRRAFVYASIQEPLIKAQRAGMPLRDLYDRRKAFELEKPDMKPIIAHKRAMRCMAKELLKDCWVADRRLAKAA